MKTVEIMGTLVAHNGIDKMEIELTIDYLTAKYGPLESLKMRADGDFIDLNYTFKRVPFERIRRITGYLTGDMSTWNEGKKAEEKDRVKHEVGMEKL